MIINEIKFKKTFKLIINYTSKSNVFDFSDSLLHLLTLFFRKPFLFDYKSHGINYLTNLLVINVVKSTILIELIGIRIAATTGSKFPVTAKNVSIQLYNKESTKLILITFMVFLLRARKRGSCSISEA